jgi:hypothetical protein
VVDAGDGTPEGPAETYERQQFPMTGIPETLEKLMLRLAAAVQIPVTILMGQSPAGMNATGESDFRWFYDRIRSEQNRKLAPRIRRLVRVMLKTKLVEREVEADAIKVKFPPLWTEPPSTAATTRKTLIDGDAALVNAAIVPPQLVALQRMATGGYERELTLTPELVRAFMQSLKDDLGSGGEGGDGENIQQTVLNGAQIASLVDIVAQVAAGTLPRDAAVGIIQNSFQVGPAEAEKMLGSAGKTFKVEPPAPASPFGGPPAPKPASPEPPSVDNKAKSEPEEVT